MEELIEYFNTQGITDPRVQANIIAQIQRESGGIPKTESLNYSPERALEFFPKYFKDLEDAKTVLAQGPEAFAHRIYGNRKDLGNESNDPNEAYKYRGRGLIQLTGRGNYEKYGKLLGIDLVNNPELANNPVIAQKIATSYYLNKGKGKDLSDINVVNKLTGFVDKGGEGQKRIELADKIFEDIRPQDVKARGVGPFEAQLQAAENEGKKLFPTYGASKVAAAPAVSPNFKVAGGYNPNKVAGGLPVALPPEEVITEKETVTEKGPGFYDRFTSGIKELLPFNEGGSVNLEEYMRAMENTNKDLIPISLPNWYTNPNDIDLSESGIEILPPDQRITPNRDDTIVEEEIILKPGNKSNAPNPFNNPNKIREDSARWDSMQEAARRSMMLENEEQRMADYEAVKENPRYYSPTTIYNPALPQMQAAQRIMGGYTEGGRVSSPQGLASLGRGGDSTLVHMQPREVAGLQQLAQANGTSLTRNPMTGYPEAFSLGGMFKAALPIAAGYMTGGGATPFLTGAGGLGMTAGNAAITAGALTGAGVAAATGDDPILGAVTGGMGGYSGMGLESAVANMPAATVSQAVPQTATSQVGMFSNPAGVSQAITPSTMATSGGMGVDDLKNNFVDATMSKNVTPTSQGNWLERLFGGAKEASNTYKNTWVDRPGGLPGEQYMMNKAVAGTTPQALMKLGSPIASMGLGGLEASDFMVKPDFNDPRDKYDPRSTLDLSRDTGVSEAMSRDTGLRLLAKGGYINGPGDGMSDDIPATINGDEPAALADGEFVIPADVVSHLGNGSSAAGSKQLHAMMERIRQARTGRKSQGKEIKPGKYMPR